MVPDHSHEAAEKIRRRSLLAGSMIAPAGIAALGGCSGRRRQGPKPDLMAKVDRAEPGSPETAAHIAGAFSGTLLGALDSAPTNLVCSPLSVQVALTMAAFGAEGQTREEMEQVLGGDVETLGEAANTISQKLEKVGSTTPDDGRGRKRPDLPRASLANAVWAQENMEVKQEYLKALGTYFGAGVHTADFTSERGRSKARSSMNGFVNDVTAGRIPEVIPPDLLTDLTRMVLINALHVKAAWPKPLADAASKPFTTSEDDEIFVPTLRSKGSGYYADDVCEATYLYTYAGEIGLALVLPKQDVPTVVQAWQEAAAQGDDLIQPMLADMQENYGSPQVEVPKFDIEWGADLTPVFTEMGMPTAFDSDTADFSGITTTEKVFISTVMHRGLITVDEEGLEAASATIVQMGATAAPEPEPPEELFFDRPFLFVVFELDSSTPLVLGWIGNPAADAK